MVISRNYNYEKNGPGFVISQKIFTGLPYSDLFGDFRNPVDGYLRN